MPKISIKEYDLTKAGTASTNNFSVVVPGFVDSTKTGKVTEDGDFVFDENGIYECSSQSDFAKAVGTVKAEKATTPGIGPEFTVLKYDEAGNEIYNDKISKQDYYQKYYNCIYTCKAAGKAAKIGKLINYLPEDTEKTGELYEFTAVEEKDFDEANNYYVIAKGKEGSDGRAFDATGHMGNQIAYYLLGLGYTVLFKKLNRFGSETGFDKTEPTGVALLKDSDFWDPLRDRVLYNFRYLISGLKSDIEQNNIVVYMSEVDKLMEAIANRNNLVDDPYETGRGDCFALCEIPKNKYVENNIPYVGEKLVKAIRNAKTISTTYAPYFVPAVTYAGEDSIYENNEFPAAFHYLACAALAFQNYREWYAVAGYTRGISPYTVKSLAARIGDRAINELQPRNSTTGAINVITGIKENYYMWGNRTGAPSKNQELVAQNFLNIRQLCCTIKKEIFDTCRRLTFDPNSDVLWTKFCLALTPMLESMKSNQGIKSYKIVKAKTDLKATLKAIVRIVPIEAVEDFDISLTLEDSVAGVLATFDEE